MKSMDLSTQKQRYVDIAKAVAGESTYPSFRHGAVLVNGNAVINKSCNKYGYSRFAARFRRRDEGMATVHAELGSILNVDRAKTEGATVYVVRINNQGETLMSRPCNMCAAAMKHCGIKKVIYSTNEGFVSETL